MSDQVQNNQKNKIVYTIKNRFKNKTEQEIDNGINWEVILANSLALLFNQDGEYFRIVDLSFLGRLQIIALIKHLN